MKFARCLQKLLSLDMNEWPNGKEQIFKMYSIIFSDCKEQSTQKLYSEFLARNGNNQSLKKNRMLPMKLKRPSKMARKIYCCRSQQ